MGKPLVNDTAGGSWQLSANPAGSLVLNFNAAAPVPPFLLAEYTAPATVYELKYVIGQGIGIFLSAGTNVPLEVAIDTAATPNVFLLQVVKARLRLVVANLGSDFVVGQLLPGDGAYPKPLQPGGIGTPVTMPVQTQGEMLGLWVAGCQHWFNHWDIHSAEIGGVTTALVCCPICLYIQRIVQPYSAIHTDANMIIFA